MNDAIARLRPDKALEAAGYVRVSRKLQAEGHSPDVQKAQLKALAVQEGYALTMIEEDHERGSSITRAGYQKIIEAVRQGTVHAVLVFTFDRWGRDGVEWLARAREFDRLGVPIISAQEGKDEPGPIRFFRAGMHEEYSRGLAKKVRPNREQAAREGIHTGPTPIGYQRVYPPITNARRLPAGTLVKDPAMGWVVAELFARYAGGGWSQRTLARWMNSDPRVPTPAAVEEARRPVAAQSDAAIRTRRAPALWSIAQVRTILRNPTYAGLVRYNKRPTGMYDRAAPNSAFTVAGRHEALVDQATFDRVQELLALANNRPSYNAPRHRALLGSGIFVCAACGGPVVLNRLLGQGHRTAHYRCSGRARGLPCEEPGFGAGYAHEALLAELRRLRGAPWTEQAEERLVGGEQRQQVEVMSHALAEERERLRRHTRLMSLMEDDPTPEQIATFREVSGEISSRIRSLEAQLAGMDGRLTQLPNLRELHEQLTQVEIATLIGEHAALGDDEGLRDLVKSLVQTAHIVERLPYRRPRWFRVAVAWRPDVLLLLEAGLLRLDPPAPTPQRPDQRTMNREYMRRHRARKRAAALEGQSD